MVTKPGLNSLNLDRGLTMDKCKLSKMIKWKIDRGQLEQNEDDPGQTRRDSRMSNKKEEQTRKVSLDESVMWVTRSNYSILEREIDEFSSSLNSFSQISEIPKEEFCRVIPASTDFEGRTHSR